PLATHPRGRTMSRTRIDYRGRLEGTPHATVATLYEALAVIAQAAGCDVHEVPRGRVADLSGEVVAKLTRRTSQSGPSGRHKHTALIRSEDGLRELVDEAAAACGMTRQAWCVEQLKRAARRELAKRSD